jgi:hypothetical protein
LQAGDLEVDRPQVEQLPAEAIPVAAPDPDVDRIEIPIPLRTGFRSLLFV